VQGQLYAYFTSYDYYQFDIINNQTDKHRAVSVIYMFM